MVLCSGSVQEGVERVSESVVGQVEVEEEEKRRRQKRWLGIIPHWSKKVGGRESKFPCRQAGLLKLSR